MLGIVFGDVISALKHVNFSPSLFTLERITGSHHIFSHPDVPQHITAQPDQNGQSKPYQLKQFAKLIEKYNLKLEDGGEMMDEDTTVNE